MKRLSFGCHQTKKVAETHGNPSVSTTLKLFQLYRSRRFTCEIIEYSVYALYLIYDAVIVAILAYFFLRGRKKGLILTLCGLAAFFVAIIGARMASDAFAPKVADLLQPRFSSVGETTFNMEKADDMDMFLSYARLDRSDMDNYLNSL